MNDKNDPKNITKLWLLCQFNRDITYFPTTIRLSVEQVGTRLFSQDCVTPMCDWLAYMTFPVTFCTGKFPRKRHTSVAKLKYFLFFLQSCFSYLVALKRIKIRSE